MGGSDSRGSLEHFGVKGMHWGQRKTRTKHEVSADAQEARETKRKISTISGTKALSNAELKTLIARMKLEQEYSRLQTSNYTNKIEKGKKVVEHVMLARKTVGVAIKFANSPLGQAITRTLLRT